MAGIAGILHKYFHAEDYVVEDFGKTWGDDYVKVLGEVRLERCKSDELPLFDNRLVKRLRRSCATACSRL